MASARCDVGLRDDADESVLPVHDWNTPHLVLAHGSKCRLQVVIFATCYQITRHYRFNLGALGVSAVGHNRQSQVAVRDDTNEPFRLLAIYHGDWAHILPLHYLRRFIDRITR
jgi:hypothetical protein